MKHLFLKSIPALLLVSLPVKDYAQGLQRYTNSLFAEYGFVQYNNNSNELLGENSKLQSIGFGYHKEVTGFLALGLKVKHYELAGPGNNTFNSNTLQVQFRLQRPRISRTFRLRRFNPYLEGGFGHATEYLNQNVDQYTAEYAYASFAAGVDYNFSDHWSLGVQGEYRLSGKDASGVTSDLRNALNTFNTVSARLNFYFGRNRHRPTVPRLYTRPGAPLATGGIDYTSRTAIPAAPSVISPANAVQLQDNVVTIKDTVLMRIVNSPATPAVINPPVDTTAVHADTTSAVKKDNMINRDTTLMVQQVIRTPAGTDTIITLSKQDTVKMDTSGVIGKKVASVQQKDTSLGIKSLTTVKRDSLLTTGTSALPKPGKDTASRPGSVLPVIKEDTALRSIRDTVTLIKRDTVTQVIRDTITVVKNSMVAKQENEATILPQAAAINNPAQLQDSGKARSTVSRERVSATPSPVVTGHSATPSIPNEGMGQQLTQLEASNADLQRKLLESETRNREQAAAINSAELARQALVQNPPIPLPALTPVSGGKNSTNLVVLPVGTGGNKKRNGATDSKEQRLMASRQDSILNQLSLIQAKLELLQQQQSDTMVKIGDSVLRADTLELPAADQDTLRKLNTGKVQTDSAKQAMNRQIWQLTKENEALQQMIGTVSGMPHDEGQDNKSQSKPVEYEVFFNVNQYKPDTAAIRQLQAFSDTLRISGAYWILLEGFADKSGHAAYNLQLSKKRVASVKAVLIDQGIPKEHILEKTFGSRFSTGLTNNNDRKVRITQVLR